MYNRIKKLYWITSILLCYLLFAAGQLWLFLSKQKTDDFYLLINDFPGDWIYAHILLMTGIVLMIPAYIGICRVLRTTKNLVIGNLSIIFISLGVFVLFGQYTIDLCIPAIFELPSEQAFAALDKIQGNDLIKSLFYDNSRVIPFLKYIDLITISQLLLGIVMIRSRKLPRWALVLYFIAMLVTQFGILIDPFWGRIIKRSGYALFSIAFIPVAGLIARVKPDASAIKDV